MAQKVFGILPVEETKGDKSFTVYADGSYKAEMPINYKISLAKRPVLLLEKDVQARANHYLDALKDIKDKSVIKNLGGISLLPDGVVIDRIEKAFLQDSKGEGWYWTVACVLKLRPSSEEDAIIVQGAGVQIDIASTGNIMRLHSTVLPIMQPKKDEGFEILDLSDLSTNNIFREDNNQLQARGGTVNSVQNIILPKLKPLLFKHNASNGTYSPFTTTNEGDKALTRWGVEEKEEVQEELEDNEWIEKEDFILDPIYFNKEGREDEKIAMKRLIKETIEYINGYTEDSNFIKALLLNGEFKSKKEVIRIFKNSDEGPKIRFSEFKETLPSINGGTLYFFVPNEEKTAFRNGCLYGLTRRSINDTTIILDYLLALCIKYLIESEAKKKNMQVFTIFDTNYTLLKQNALALPIITLLHEVVHYGDMTWGRHSSADMTDESDIEAGNDFEQQAFGRISSYTDFSVSYAIYSRYLTGENGGDATRDVKPLEEVKSDTLNRFGKL